MIKRREFGKTLVGAAAGASIAGGINPRAALAQAGRTPKGSRINKLDI